MACMKSYIDIWGTSTYSIDTIDSDGKRYS